MELDKGSNFRIDLNIVRDRSGEMDITYLVREIFVWFGFMGTQLSLKFCANLLRLMLMCKSSSPDPEQRSAGENWPLQVSKPSAGFPHHPHYQRDAAVVPLGGLLPHKRQPSGVRLHLGGRQGFLHGHSESLLALPLPLTGMDLKVIPFPNRACVSFPNLADAGTKETSSVI